MLNQLGHAQVPLLGWAEMRLSKDVWVKLSFRLPELYRNECLLLSFIGNCVVPWRKYGKMCYPMMIECD